MTVFAQILRLKLHARIPSPVLNLDSYVLRSLTLIWQQYADLATHAKALGQKYQKVMGLHPSTHREEMFRDTAIHADKDLHPVPVSNFLNAQCTL